MKKICFTIMGICFFSACGADKPVEVKGDGSSPKITKELSPVEETAEVSSRKKRANSLLHAPANYIKTTVGQIDKAKKAAAVYEKSSLEHMDISGSSGE